MEKFVKFLLNICTCWFIVYGGFCGTAFACESNKIDVLGDGTQCELAKFSITTTSLTLPDESEFRWYMSAKGTFYVDCGTDGTLSGTGVSGKTITRTNTNIDLYTCTYTTGDVKTIRMAGLATGYNNRQEAAIRFGYKSTADTTPELVNAINGSIGQIFPTLVNASVKNPAYRYTFTYTKISSVSEQLFDGNTGNSPQMFETTFKGCKSLHYIPSGLFSGITGAAYYMFHGTFSETPLYSIPENLFAGIYGSAQGLFNSTFIGANITTVSPRLFANTTGGDGAFQNTFRYSTIQSIPSGLFDNITEGFNQIFDATFMGCSRLTSIPTDLFKNIKSIPNHDIFRYVFFGCYGLQGRYIPPQMFAGLVANGSPNPGSGVWDSAFNDTYMATTCPSGTVQFVTGYEQYWGGKVSCVDENLVCNSGEYFPNHWYECKTCPENNYCVGGTYTFNETVTQGIESCPNNWYSPAGSSSVAQCGRILHVGDGMVYLRSTKQTTPSLNVQIGDDIFYGNMTTADVPMNINTERKLKVSYDDTTYSVYDDTVTVPE